MSKTAKQKQEWQERYDALKKGMMIIFAETKLDANTHEVVEICVPDQWLIYQKYLAKIDSIYYFDMPEKYLQLQVDYPNLFYIGNIADVF